MLKVIAMIIICGLWPANAVPPGFNVQGRLTDASGINLSADNFNVKFSIFDAQAGGTLLWGKTMNDVSVKNGGFQVTLEDPGTEGAHPLLKDALAGDTAYLEFQVVGGGPLTAPEPPVVPRQQLVSVPFAIRAGRVSRPQFPKGVIVMWSGQASAAPAGWCLCDGRTCATPEGGSVTTPDLSGKFIMGAKDSADVGGTGGGDDPIIDPPAAWSTAISGWSFHSYPGLTKDATKVRWQKFDIPAVQMGPGYFYPKYYKLAYIMKL